MPLQPFYLHGFASSPESSKAQFFRERLARRGLPLHVPDFNQPEFSTLTVSRMLQQVERQIAALSAGEVVLFGSSLGGLVAVEAARRQAHRSTHPVTRLILLAPAVELTWDRWAEIAAAGGIDDWRTKGAIEVFHYADNRMRRLDFSFYEDANRYRTSEARLDLPMLIVQGRLDESVDPAGVERFARAQPNATLHLVDDGHQLKESLDVIWRGAERFLFPPSREALRRGTPKPGE